MIGAGVVVQGESGRQGQADPGERLPLLQGVLWEGGAVPARGPGVLGPEGAQVRAPGHEQAALELCHLW